MLIIAKYINDNSDSFININNFNSNDDETNIKEPNNNNNDPIIPLFNKGGTPLNTIDKEDKGLIFSPAPKKTRRGTRILLIRQRI
jgi:hypothetical protein